MLVPIAIMISGDDAVPPDDSAAAEDEAEADPHREEPEARRRAGPCLLACSVNHGRARR